MTPPLIMLIDLQSCSGCHACAVACKAEHRPQGGTQRLGVQYVDFGVFPQAGRAFIPSLCQHCTDAPCIEACPVTAIGHAPDGSVQIDAATCICSGPCVSACPYGAIALDGIAAAAQKCDWCAERRGRDEPTACQATCPTHAIHIGALDDPAIEAELLRGTYTTWEPQPTSPRVRYGGLTPEIAASLRRIDEI